MKTRDTELAVELIPASTSRRERQRRIATRNLLRAARRAGRTAARPTLPAKLRFEPFVFSVDGFRSMPAPAEIVARFQAAVQRDGPDATVHYRGTQCYVI